MRGLGTAGLGCRSARVERGDGWIGSSIRHRLESPIYSAFLGGGAGPSRRLGGRGGSCSLSLYVVLVPAFACGSVLCVRAEGGGCGDVYRGLSATRVSGVEFPGRGRGPREVRLVSGLASCSPCVRSLLGTSVSWLSHYLRLQVLTRLWGVLVYSPAVFIPALLPRLLAWEKPTWL